MRAVPGEAGHDLERIEERHWREEREREDRQRHGSYRDDPDGRHPLLAAVEDDECGDH